MENQLKIKMVGLDLDGTTLNKDGKLSEETKRVFKEVAAKGVHIVVATGRTFDSLPKEIVELDELEYIITSNGAHITRLCDMEVIHSNFIPEEAIERLVPLFIEKGYSIEAFTGGKAYIDKREYDYFKSCKESYRNLDYVLSTRNPVEGLHQFMLDHKGEIENINLNFEFLEDKAKARDVLLEVPGITLTSSFVHNWEIGGGTTSKGNALNALADILGVIPEDELLACGDSPNDIAMIKLAKVGVAVENATDETKAAADYVFPSNEDDGVAKAITRFVK